MSGAAKQSHTFGCSPLRIFPSARGCGLVSMHPRPEQGLKLEIRAFRGGGGGLDLCQLQRAIKQRDIK